MLDVVAIVALIASILLAKPFVQVGEKYPSVHTVSPAYLLHEFRIENQGK